MAARSAGVAMPARGDAVGLREMVDMALAAMHEQRPDAPEVSLREFAAVAEDGASIPMRWYQPAADPPGSAIVYAHGGGMVAGTLDNYDRLMRYYVQLTGVPFLAVDYRLAPEHRGPTAARDVLAAIRWMLQHAPEMSVDPTRIALMGDSGGGGVGAGAAIAARDAGLDLAGQILIYPMLDDRNTVPDPTLEATATWGYDNNFTGWSSAVGPKLGQHGVDPLTAPARLQDFAGLAAAYIEVGDLDIFRDESVDYARRLWAAGVACELHVHSGAPHGFDWINSEAVVTRRALEDRARVIRSF